MDAEEEADDDEPAAEEAAALDEVSAGKDAELDPPVEAAVVELENDEAEPVKVALDEFEPTVVHSPPYAQPALLSTVYESVKVVEHLSVPVGSVDSVPHASRALVTYGP